MMKNTKTKISATVQQCVCTFCVFIMYIKHLGACLFCFICLLRVTVPCKYYVITTEKKGGKMERCSLFLAATGLLYTDNGTLLYSFTSKWGFFFCLFVKICDMHCLYRWYVVRQSSFFIFILWLAGDASPLVLQFFCSCVKMVFIIS